MAQRMRPNGRITMRMSLAKTFGSDGKGRWAASCDVMHEVGAEGVRERVFNRACEGRENRTGGRQVAEDRAEEHPQHLRQDSVQREHHALAFAQHQRRSEAGDGVREDHSESEAVG